MMAETQTDSRTTRLPPAKRVPCSLMTTPKLAQVFRLLNALHESRYYGSIEITLKDGGVVAVRETRNVRLL